MVSEYGPRQFLGKGGPSFATATWYCALNRLITPIFTEHDP